jgi:hypothetical protein
VPFVIATGFADFVSTNNGLIGKVHRFQLSEMGSTQVLTVGHGRIEGDDDRAFQFNSVKVFLNTIARGAIQV